MRDLHHKKPKPAPRNRLKKQKKPVNWRGFFRKVVRAAGAVVAVSLVSVICYDLYALFARTTFLRLERIEVGTLKKLTRDEVVAMAGVKPGDDMFSLRLKRIGELMVKNPWVEKVTVRRYFPHTLSIELVEREPVAVVNMGYLYYLDKKGEVFKPLNEGDPIDYPVVTGITEEDMVKDPKGSREAFQGALSIISLLAGRSVFSLGDISEVHYDKGFGFTLFTARGGVPVRLGNSGFDAKIDRLSKVYNELQPQMVRMQYIDLDYSDKIVVKKV